MSDACPCHSGQPYAACCRPMHQGRAAPTPTALLRSRYAAYALGKVGYVINTTHPGSPLRQEDPAAWRRELKQFCAATSFVDLRIDPEEPLSSDQTVVPFHASLFQGARDVSFSERSLFVRRQGRWWYVAPTAETSAS